MLGHVSGMCVVTQSLCKMVWAGRACRHGPGQSWLVRKEAGKEGCDVLLHCTSFPFVEPEMGCHPVRGSKVEGGRWKVEGGRWWLT